MILKSERRLQLYSPILSIANEEQSKNWYAPMDTAYRKCELVYIDTECPQKKEISKYRMG